MIKTPSPRLFEGSLLATLREHANWVTWCLEPDPKRDGKLTKVLYNAKNGYLASSTNSATWSTFETACNAYSNNTTADGKEYTGIGFVFSKDDPFCGIDLDHCIDEQGRTDEWAQSYIQRMRTYWEASPSETGRHGLALGSVPKGRRQKVTGQRDPEAAIELYSEGRYFTITGNHLEGTPIDVEDCRDVIDEIYAELNPTKEQSKSGPAGQETIFLTDNQIISKARASKQGEKFTALFLYGDTTGYLSASEADLALCNMLAFWSGKDGNAMDRLFHRSGLYRDKWDETHGDATYGQITINKAIDDCTGVYGYEKMNVNGQGSNGNGHKSEEKKQKDEKPNQTKVLLDICQKGRYFKTPEGDLCASVPINGHRETVVIGEKGSFRQWLIRRYYEQTGDVASTTAVAQAIEVMAATTSESAPTEEMFTRVGHKGDKIYLDLVNDKHQVVEIDADGWRVLPVSPINFRRGTGMLPLPDPVRGGKIEELRQFLNLNQENNGDWHMVVGDILMMLHPTGPYPVMALGGEQGATKSSTARYIRSTIDPNIALSRSAPKEERDLAIAARNNWVISLENLSHIPEWLSNAMCTLSTGSGYATRALWEDDKEIVFANKRPQIVNGIGDLVTRGDLLSRTITLSLPVMDKSKYKTERELNTAWKIAHPRILGAILDCTSAAIRNLPYVSKKSTSRMVEMEMWMYAAEPALGWEEGTFTASFKENQDSGVDVVLESSQVAKAVMAFVERYQEEWNTPWKGSSTVLDKELREIMGDDLDHKSWPANPKTLSDAIKKLAPSLRARGIYASHKKSNGTRFIELMFRDADRDAGTQNRDAGTQENESASLHNHTNEADDGKNRDARDAESTTLSNPDILEKKEKAQIREGIEEVGDFCVPCVPVTPKEKIIVKKESIPIWLIPGTRDWNQQVAMHGVEDVRQRRQAWFDEQARKKSGSD